MTRTVALVNLGCPKNQVDAETMLGILARGGYQVTPRLEEAQVIIVNTCGFIGPAKEESIEKILEVAQYKEVGQCETLVVSGCLSQRYHKSLASSLPEVDLFLGTGQVDKIDVLLEGSASLVGKPDDYNSLAEEHRLFSTWPHGYLKIAEGCNNNCSYCVIPRLRGKLRSKDPHQVLREAQRLMAGGVKELVVIAQDISQYGLDYAGKSDLPSLLRQLDNLVGDKAWIRLLYCYPDHITTELLEVIAQAKSICKYLDIPLQHVHPEILGSMGRFRSRQDPLDLIAKIRRAVPEIALRTTFIVGYPGEREHHFQGMLDFVKAAQLDHLGAFIYSPERGTKAARLPDQVKRGEKSRRHALLMEAQQRIVFRRNELLVGRNLKVLVDGPQSQGLWIARSYREAPEIDSHVIVQGNVSPGNFYQAEITGSNAYDLQGVIRDGDR